MSIVLCVPARHLILILLLFLEHINYCIYVTIILCEYLVITPYFLTTFL